MSDKKEKMTFSDKTAYFIQKNKAILLGIMALIVLAVVGLLAFTIIQNGMRVSSAKAMDEIRQKYEEYQTESDEAKKTELENSIVVSVDALAKKYPALIAAQEALMLRADLAASKQEFAVAQEAYFQAYSGGKDSFVAPFALKRAASAAESAENLDKAIEYHEILVKEYEKKMPGMALSYFNLGRLYEAKKDYAKANETFAKMSELFPSDSWTNLGKSRIIFLKSQGLVP